MLARIKEQATKTTSTIMPQLIALNPILSGAGDRGATSNTALVTASCGGMLQPLTPRDSALSAGLLASLAPLGESGWCSEVGAMIRRIFFTILVNEHYICFCDGPIRIYKFTIAKQSCACNLTPPARPTTHWQIREMVHLGAKADIEALYLGPEGMSGMNETLLRAVLRREYV